MNYLNSLKIIFNWFDDVLIYNIMFWKFFYCKYCIIVCVSKLFAYKRSPPLMNSKEFNIYMYIVK